MSGTIVIGVTQAPVSARVVDWAAQRAADQNERIRMISVVLGAAGQNDLVEEIVTATRDDLDQTAATLRERGLEVEVSVPRGNVVPSLVEACHDATVLVIGSDYRGPHTEPVHGARGIRIAAAAPCPVIVVPDFALGDRAGVVVGVDGSEVSENAITFAAAAAARLREPLIAVSAWTPVTLPRRMTAYPEDYLTNLRLLTEETLAMAIAGVRADHPDLQIMTRVERGHPSAVVNDSARSARMAVMGTRGRGAFGRFLLGSVAHEVLLRMATVTAVVR